MKKQIDWQMLGFEQAQVEYWQKYIDSQKQTLRELTDKELVNDYVLVSRANSPLITYSEDYKAEEKAFKTELKAKYPPTRVDRPNFSIELKALPKSTEKTEATIKCSKLTAHTINKRMTKAGR